MDQSVRSAVFDGKFYPGTKAELYQLIHQIYEIESPLINNKLATHHLIGGVVPHAGYTYSAYQAVHFYALLQKSKQHFDTFVILNPNHTGYGSGLFNSCSYQMWETPFSRIACDNKFQEALDITANNSSHALEHSGEVQLPMLQYFYHNPFKVSVITMNQQTVESARLLAAKIHQAALKTGRKILVIASSDFSHFESPEKGFRKDQYVIDQILKLDSEGISNEVKRHRVTACGYGTIMALIEYAKLAYDQPEISILKRGHSGDVFPSNEVVSYISFLCYETSMY